MSDKICSSALRIVGLVVLLVWPVMNLVGDIQSLRSDFYNNKFSDQIVTKVKALSREKDAVSNLGQYYPMYQPGEQIHPQD